MFQNVLAGIRMIFICSFISLYLIVVGIPILSYSRLTRNPRIALYFTKLLARIGVPLGGVRLKVRGVEKLNPNRGCVYVGNHTSHVDGAVVLMTLPGDVRFLIKKEAFRIPLVSFAFRTMGMIEVDRSNPEASARSIDRAVSEIQAGRSVILFPEGTRSRQPIMLPFKKGAFVLAIKAQAPVVPFTVIGAERALPPDTILLRGGDVELIFHDPIETTGLDLDDSEKLLKEAESRVNSALIQTEENEE